MKSMNSRLMKTVGTKGKGKFGGICYFEKTEWQECYCSWDAYPLQPLSADHVQRPVGSPASHLSATQARHCYLTHLVRGLNMASSDFSLDSTNMQMSLSTSTQDR